MPMLRRMVSFWVAVAVAAAGAAGALPWADERRELQVCVCGGPPMCTDGGCYEPLQGQDCDNGSPPEQDLCADCSSCNTGAALSAGAAAELLPDTLLVGEAAAARP